MLVRVVVEKVVAWVEGVKRVVGCTGRGITLTLALSHQRERGQDGTDPTPNSSRGLGTTVKRVFVETGLGEVRGLAKGVGSRM